MSERRRTINGAGMSNPMNCIFQTTWTFLLVGVASWCFVATNFQFISFCYQFLAHNCALVAAKFQLDCHAAMASRPKGLNLPDPDGATQDWWTVPNVAMNVSAPSPGKVPALDGKGTVLSQGNAASIALSFMSWMKPIIIHCTCKSMRSASNHTSREKKQRWRVFPRDTQPTMFPWPVSWTKFVSFLPMWSSLLLMEEEKKSDSTNTEQGKAKNSKSKKERREDPAEREQQNILKRSSDCEQNRDAQAHSKQWREDNPEKCKCW